MDNVFPWIDVEARKLPDTTPRFLQTHLRSDYYLRQLEGNSPCPKFVVVIRNPKDVHVSFYHFHKFYLADAVRVENQANGWDEYFQELKLGHLLYGNIFDHVLGWWKYRDHPNVILIRYEDLKSDPKSTIAKLAGFLDMEITEDIVEDVMKNTSFSAMKSRPANYYGSYMATAERKSGKTFFRKGEVGSWKEQLTREQEEYFNENIRQRYLPEGLHYD